METNKYIKVAYELTAIDGTERESIETATAQEPYTFVSGLGVNLDAFEQHTVGLQTGDKFDFTLTVEEGYGEYHEDFVQRVPKHIFELNGKIDERFIHEGAVVPLQNAEGQRFNGLITKIGDTEITVDLNHPLAGKELNFKGEIVESREATNKEIQDIINMLTGAGGCGGCGGKCGGDCGGEGGCGEGGCGNCGGCSK